MGKENEIKFSEVKFSFEFTVYAYDTNFDDEGLSVYIAVDCGEGIEDLMKSYLDKKWAELFDSQGIDVRYISRVEFNGIRVSAKDNNGNKLWCGTGGRPYANVRLNYDWLAEDNAKKIRQIKEIIN